jgi:hypothetical protein
VANGKEEAELRRLFFLNLFCLSWMVMGCQPKPIVTSLSGANIKDAMKEVLGQFQACFDQYKIPGLAEMSFTVEGSTGGVLHAQAVGTFKGTPTGDCVAAVVEKMEFPRFPGPPTQHTYSVIFK